MRTNLCYLDFVQTLRPFKLSIPSVVGSYLPEKVIMILVSSCLLTSCGGTTSNTFHATLIQSLMSYATTLVNLHLQKQKSPYINHSYQITTNLLFSSIVPTAQIRFLGKIQSRGTNIILNDYSSDYNSHLISLLLLHLMMSFELSFH